MKKTHQTVKSMPVVLPWSKTTLGMVATRAMLAVSVACVLGGILYVQLSFYGTPAVYHDNYNIGYPLRVLISTAVQNGIFPLWDHWIHGGVPLSTVYVCPNFSPLILFLSLFGIYTPTTFIVEIIVTLLVGCAGMYFWLRGYASRWPALLGASCYVLSASVLVTALINFEMVVSFCMFPWFAFGLQRALRGRPHGAAIVALALFWMFTSGYVGVNVVACCWLTSYCAAEFLFRKPSPMGELCHFKWSAWRGPVWAGVGLGLFLALFSYIILETQTFVHWNYDQLREGTFDPMEAAAQRLSWFTFAYPNEVNAFMRYEGLEHPSLVYLGAAGLACMCAAVVMARKWRVVILLCIWLVACYATMLGKTSFTGVLATKVLPLYDKVRFHVYFGGLVLFFAATLLGRGLVAASQRGMSGRRLLTLCVSLGSVVTCGVVYMSFMNVSVTKVVLFPQTVFVAAILMAVYLRGRRQIRRGAFYALASVIIVGEMYCVLPSVTKLGLQVAPGLRTACEQLKTTGFVANVERRQDKYTGPGYDPNIGYYTKVPMMYGYNPNTHPRIFQLMKDKSLYERLTRYMFYARDDMAKSELVPSVAGEIKVFTPNRIEANFEAPSDHYRIVWSSGYSTGWRAYVDGQKTPLLETEHGLTEFALSRGRHQVVLKYAPAYLWPSLTLVCLAFLTCVALLVRALPRFRAR